MTSITPGQLSDWALDLAAYTDGTEPTSYVPLRGMTEFSPPMVEKNQEDDSDYDGGVWGSSTSTGLAYKLEGACKLPRGGMTADPGQELLKAANKGVAEAGYVHFRAYNKISGKGFSGVVDATFTPNGGKRTDLTTAGFTLTGRGALADYTNATVADATATAILSGGVLKGANVTKGGSGYTVAPTVVISGPGTGATAVALISGGQVVDVNVTAGGTGYTSASISFTR